MALYAIGDLHLSLGCDKPMDVFGGRWENYVEKIKEGFADLHDDDTTVLCGDLSWGMDMSSAGADFQFIHALPGKKIILKGNHDYWWTTASKAYKFFEEKGIDSISILHNNCYFYGDIAICGTRGWFYEAERGDEHDKKIMQRELLRLEASLNLAGEREKMVFLHYPPKCGDYECFGITELLREYKVTRCYYGHLHGIGCKGGFQGEYNGTRFQLVSADNVLFHPVKVCD
jgi:hypothetical protein